MKTLLKVENLKVTTYGKVLVDNLSFSVNEGECLGILGESGSGKSMSCKAVMGLLDKNFQIEGKAYYYDRNLLKESGESMRKLRGKEIAMVLQNPMTCFDPLYTVGSQMAETFAEHLNISQSEIREKSIEVLKTMQLKNPEDILAKYPHQLSGGMLQRIMIGLALAMNPKLIIADEPTTAIDAVTQYEIVKEFIKIKEEYKVGLIFISHDLGVISKIADRVIVMNSGKAVAQGNKDIVFSSCDDNYTKMLLEKKMAVMKKYKEILHGRGDNSAVES